MRVGDLESIKIKLASPEDILSWSHGEVTKPETINYRTQKPEKDGLFCEKIFGPEKDYECYCGKYRKIRYKGIVCDKCGVEVTKAWVRRERMGHIKLASPCSHIWFLRGVPSRIGTILGVSTQQLERVIYFASYIVTDVLEEAKNKKIEEIEKEYKQKLKALDSKTASAKRKTADKELKKARDRAREEVLSLKPLKIISEMEYHYLSLKYGEVFKAGTGAETIRKIFVETDFKKIIEGIKKDRAEIKTKSPRSASAAAYQRVILRRLKVIQGMLDAKIKPEWMFLTHIPVLPPDLRPMVQLDGGKYASSDLNDLYRRIINRNNRLYYLLEINAPGVIVRNEKRMLQEAVDALIDNGMRKGQTTTATTGGKRMLKSLADMLKGKQGRFRQNLLGKRVDYSGRSVIVVGPELKLHQCGIPKKMALELFKPFVIKKILEKELAYNVRSASKLIDEAVIEVWAILEELVKDKLVLLNRAPTLHRLGVQAFQPILIEEEAIRLHPLVCRAFNADFDGDQMAVHLFLSREAQKEARDIMLSTLNLLKPATGTPIVGPVYDIVLGCYWITVIVPGSLGEGKIFGSKNEAILARDFNVVDLRARIKVRIKDLLIETSVGRILFNNTLPANFPFQNEEMNFRRLEKLTSKMIESSAIQTIHGSLDKIKDLGFEYSTISGITWGMNDLAVPKEKPKLIAEANQAIETIDSHYKNGLLSKEEKTAKAIEVWQKTKVEIEKLIPKTLPYLGSVFTIISSGARGSWTQPVQMAGMKGLVTNPAGEILEFPIKSSFKEGFGVLEYFISTHGARKGTADTALRTSMAGYLTRRLVDVSHNLVITEQDCQDENGITIFKEDAREIGQDFLFKIVGRVSVENVKGKIANGKLKTIVKAGEIIDWDKADEIQAAAIEQLKVRSPMSCQATRGICQKCYGWDLGNNQLIKEGEAVGIVAAQSIGEPGTQLTMRTFHTGGVAEGGDITQGLPRVEEIFEIRVPGGKAVIAKTDGEVVEITPERVIRIKTQKKKELPLLTTKRTKAKKEDVKYKILPNRAIWVEKGEKIKAGQQLCEGSLDLKELFEVTDKGETQRYIVKEIQKIYVSQGAIIHDKHLEVIICQMFSRLRIKEPGDTRFFTGEIVSATEVAEENATIRKTKKRPAIAFPVLLGISKVALTTDSFLSASSFQETSRVLIKAAMEGKRDRLIGLKENVIIGKLIPAGTGFKKQDG